MEEVKKAKSQERKKYAPDGQRSQKMMTFKIDFENVEWLNQFSNKGRYINELLEADRKKQSRK